LFGAMMDITDNFESLNRFVIIGDTPAQAFMEKMVGFMCGFALVAVGLIRWIPTITSMEHDKHINKELEQEIAERKQAEETLIESDRMFMRTFYKTIDAALLIEDGVFVDCNTKAIEMLQASSKDEVLNTHPSQLSPETQPDGRSSHKKADEIIATAFDKGSNRFEWEHLRLNGEVFPVEVTLTPISLFGKQQLHCTWKDITEQKQAQERYEENIAETERMNRLMGGREERVIEMKKEVNALLAELGKEPQYKSVLEDEEVAISSE